MGQSGCFEIADVLIQPEIYHTGSLVVLIKTSAHSVFCEEKQIMGIFTWL